MYTCVFARFGDNHLGSSTLVVEKVIPANGLICTSGEGSGIWGVVKE